MTYPRKAILSNVGVVAVIFIAAFFSGNIRSKDNGITLFVVFYTLAFLINMVLCIWAFATKKKVMAKIHLILLIALVLLALPIGFLLIAMTGGFC